jgi:hypothetical protein
MCRLDRNAGHGGGTPRFRRPCRLLLLVPVRPSAVRRRGVVEGDAPAVGRLKRPRVAPRVLHTKQKSHTHIFRQRIHTTSVLTTANSSTQWPAVNERMGGCLRRRRRSAAA